MITPKFTTGPWITEEDYRGGSPWLVYGQGSVLVADLRAHTPAEAPETDEEIEANRDLIVAAPGARLGIACTSPQGEDLGWTPVAIVDGEEGKELRFQDGNYGIIEWLMSCCPYERTDADEDEASKWVDYRLSLIEEDLWRGVVSGAKEGVCPTDSPIRWKLVTADEYDGKI